MAYLLVSDLLFVELLSGELEETLELDLVVPGDAAQLSLTYQDYQLVLKVILGHNFQFLFQTLVIHANEGEKIF